MGGAPVLMKGSGLGVAFQVDLERKTEEGHRREATLQIGCRVPSGPGQGVWNRSAGNRGSGRESDVAGVQELHSSVVTELVTGVTQRCHARFSSSEIMSYTKTHFYQC